MIDISSIQPNQVSRDPRGYSMLLYGGPKVGKTTFATRADKHLLLAFEKGYSTLPNVMAIPMNSWADFRAVLVQLEQDRKRVEIARANGEKAEPMFETIIVDIVDIAWDYCEKYILSRENVAKVGDIPYGAGYKMIADEFDSKLRSIVRMDYGLVMISHANFTMNQEDDSIKVATPTLAKRPKTIVTRLVDLYAFVTMEMTDEGTVHTMHLRETPEWEAGSRFRYMKDAIPLNYGEMVKEIVRAIDKEAEETDTVPTEELINRYTEGTEIQFDTIMGELKELTGKIMSTVSAEDKASTAAAITDIVDRALGQGKKISDATEHNIEQLRVILMELQEL